MLDPVKTAASNTAYRIYGDPAAAPLLVFVHGVGLNHSVWQPQVDFFSKDFTVLAYDMLGHGDSCPPAEDATLDDYVLQLRQLLDTLQVEKAHIIGHSMGALVSLAFALQHPQSIITLTLLNAVYERSHAQRVQVIDRARRVRETASIAGIDAALARWFPQPADSPAEHKSIEQVRRWMQATDPRGYAVAYSIFAESDRAFSGRLAGLGIPALFMTAEHDPNSTPAMARAMAEQTPQGRTVIIEDEAHMMAYRSPQRVNPVIHDFILRHETTAGN